MSSDTGPTREEWEGKTSAAVEGWDWLSMEQKVLHNFPAWHAHRNGGQAQWWTGANWRDEAKQIPDYMLANIEHPQRIKPGCTVQPVELRIVREDCNVGSDAKA